MYTTEHASTPFHCAFYAGRHFIEGQARHLSFSGIAVEVQVKNDDDVCEGSRGECFIDGKLGQQSSSCGFDCEVVSADDHSLVLRFNPLNDSQIKFIRTLNAY